jgi:hypothetical protein
MSNVVKYFHGDQAQPLPAMVGLFAHYEEGNKATAILFE